MSPGDLVGVARELVAPDKGLLAIDESAGTCNRPLRRARYSADPEAGRDWRELLVTTPGLSQSINRTILYYEAISDTVH